MRPDEYHGYSHKLILFLVRCELKSGNVLRAGETIGFGDDSSPAPKSADIVLLVEQKGCLKNTRIGTISMDIDHALKASFFLIYVLYFLLNAQFMSYRNNCITYIL